MYEFQRWNVTQEQYWGSDYDANTMLGHLLATDRGRWCTEGEFAAM